MEYLCNYRLLFTLRLSNFLETSAKSDMLFFFRESSQILATKQNSVSSFLPFISYCAAKLRLVFSIWINLMKPSLVIATSNFWPSVNGISTVTQELSRRFVNYGYDVTVITARLFEQPQKECWELINIIRIKTKGQGTILSRYAGEIDLYRQVLINTNADIYLFIAWETWMVDMAIPIFPQLRGKKVMASHGTSVHWKPPGLKGWIRQILWLPHRWRYTKSLDLFDHFVLLTELAERNRFNDKIMLDKRNATNWSVIPNGTNWRTFNGQSQDFRTKYNLNECFIILYVANYSWSKNQEGLLRILRKIESKNLAVVFIGSEINSYAQYLQKRYVVTQDLRERVYFLSHQSQEEIHSAYSAANLFVCTSLTEAQPLVILDAMASGTPFVTLDVGCVREFPGGITVKTEQEMVEKVRLLIHDEVARTQLGLAGREACQNMYDWDQSAEKYNEVFSQMLLEKKL